MLTILMTINGLIIKKFHPKIDELNDYKTMKIDIFVKFDYILDEWLLIPSLVCINLFKRTIVSILLDSI